MIVGLEFTLNRVKRGAGHFSIRADAHDEPAVSIAGCPGARVFCDRALGESAKHNLQIQAAVEKNLLGAINDPPMVQ